jgi:integrase
MALEQRQRLYTAIYLPLAPSPQTGVEPKSAQDRLGHAVISVTLNTYTHILPETRTEVARKMEEVIL